jgi:hypothetical protein
MKKTLLTLTATLAALAAFAQGKVGFQNDSLHLVYYDNTTGSLAGKTVYDTQMPAGTTLVADLYMGTASASLSFYSSTSFGGTALGPGKWNPTSVTANNPFVASGHVFVQVQIRDNSVGAPPIFTGLPIGNYYGKSSMFDFTLGTGITYPVMWGANGNWPVGTQDLSGVDGNLPGSRGAIAVSSTIIPEPTSFALAGLGAAALMVIRRRK